MPSSTVATPATPRQENFLNSLIKELGDAVRTVLNARQTQTWIAFHNAEVISKDDASDLIGALVTAKKSVAKKPKERKNAAPGYYTTNGKFVVVVENRAKTRTYAKELVVVTSGARTTASWQYRPGLGYDVADLQPLTLDEARAFGHLHGVCVICARQLRDPKSVEDGIGPVCSKKIGG